MDKPRYGGRKRPPVRQKNFDRGYREDLRDEQAIISGRHPVLEALQKGIVVKIEILESAHGSVIQQIEREAAKRSISCIRCPFESMTEGASQQGVRATIKPVEVRHDLLDFIEDLDCDESPLLLMLDGIEDPHNFGAILRSAYVSGVSGVVIRSRRQAPMTSTVFKTSAGAAALIPIFEVNNLEQVLRSLKPMGWWAVAAMMNEMSTDYHDLDWKRPTVLIMGAEGKGVSDLLVKRSDDLVSIPMVGKLDSLNVSVATGILLFEATHVKLTKKGK